MCGRYSITIDKSTIERRFNAKFATGTINFEPIYNAAPSQLLPIITTYAPNEIVLAKWGFVPEQWTSSRIRPQNNARVETAAEKPMFHSSFSGRHCLVITDGFYEWKTIDGKKYPYRFMMKSREPFAMAGIYARDHDDHSRYNFAILTKDANEVMALVHDRR
jgi:putative SOS response-associated peptidase YedK